MTSFVCASDTPICGSLPLSAALPAILRIPVPGTAGLAIELKPRGYVPQSGSTSTIFIQDKMGKRNLRLDYGFNKNTGAFEWHWNQKGTAANFGISNHSTAKPGTAALGQTARYFKYAGRGLIVVAAVTDVYSIVKSSTPLRRSIQVVSAWTAAAGACKVVGAGGAYAGSFAPGPGNVIGGLAGCAVGGFIGYMAAERISGYMFDWAEGTFFTPLVPEPFTPAPDSY